MFSVGIGPSSSHTVGPMRAAKQFVDKVLKENKLHDVARVKVDLFGSLALTGHGHGTDKAVLLGLMGMTPEGTDPEEIEPILSKIRSTEKIFINREKEISFVEAQDLLFHKDRFLPFHPNGIRFTAFDAKGQELSTNVYYSVGGGFVVSHDQAKGGQIVKEDRPLPYPFKTGDEILAHCRANKIDMVELIKRNEESFRPFKETKEALIHIWEVMDACINRGVHQTGILPGGLKVKRRANNLFQKIEAIKGKPDPALIMDYISMWALAVNEENAAGGRVVTAPTNGAAGVVPATLKYYMTFTENPTIEGVVNFLLVAGAMGILFKLGASISAAEMGCMGEVGVACSMAAAGLTAALGGSSEQIENAAEIGMEHHLGLTCDPVMGLVQIPCIERNTMGAIKAINASRLALSGDGTHRVSLDQVIAAMRETGHNMQSIYKETSQGGLAVNVPEC